MKATTSCSALGVWLGCTVAVVQLVLVGTVEEAVLRVRSLDAAGVVPSGSEGLDGDVVVARAAT